MKAFPLPGFLSALDRKLLRDLWGMKGQAVAIAFVIAGGVAVYLVAAGMLASLEETRRTYYERYRFADGWASVVRAPQSLISGIRRIEGVQAAETRIRIPVLLDIPGMDEPASGEVLSLPDDAEAAVNRIHLARGRYPERGRRGEAVVLESFAEAHELAIGDTVSATIHGGRERLVITGVALSPEYVYAIAPGQIVPDPRLFGVLWMSRDSLAEAVNQDGAFNELIVRLEYGAREDAVFDRLDRVLAPYGAAGAYGRDEQVSDAFVSSEIDQLHTMGNLLPPIFLLVAAFLVNVVMSRLIATERDEIGLMKAFGYADTAVVLHYLKLCTAVGLLGLAIGAGLGIWLGRLLATVYAEYYNFPLFVFEVDPRVYAIAIAMTALALGGGAGFAVRRAALLEPAEAMNPPSPPDYSRALGSGVARLAFLDQQTRMVLRQIVRFPLRSGFTTVGVAVSGALLIGTLFFLDSMEEMIDVHFNVANRYDVQVTLVEPRSRGAYLALLRAPGVLDGEPYRSVPARLRLGHREERVALIGTVTGGELSRVVDLEQRPVTPSPGGVVLSRDLADRLAVRTGDVLIVKVSDGRRPVLEVPVARITTTFIGSMVQMRIEDLNRLMHEGAVVSGAWLKVDPAASDIAYRALKSAPAVAGVGLQRAAERNFTELMEQNIGMTIWVYSAFAGLIAIGVVYNSVRISFAERQRELASLCVLGFTRGEVSYILLGEIAFLTLLALPIGAGLGTLMAFGFSHAVSSDLFRLPFVVHSGTYGYAAVVVIVTTAVSSLLVRRGLDRMDLAAVLKSRD